jgi:hypothetical protein
LIGKRVSIGERQKDKIDTPKEKREKKKKDKEGFK